jgi:glutathione synthase/RimK-type ligase-like ATP-grasp enzyme
MNAWEGLYEHEPVMRDKITELLREAQPRMRPPKPKATFELYGVDMAMTEQGDIWIIEVNRSPRLGDAV